jgi:hypothetical protein
MDEWRYSSTILSPDPWKMSPGTHPIGGAGLSGHGDSMNAMDNRKVHFLCRESNPNSLVQPVAYLLYRISFSETFFFLF